MAEKEIRFGTGRGDVSAAWSSPRGSEASIVVAPGAGSGYDAPFLVGFTRALNGEGIATLRFNFPYGEAGRRSPDREPVLRAAWLTAFAEAARRSKDGARIFAGGKSMGGRFASMCVADGMPAAGLVFLGYPLHPPKDPAKLRDEHLYAIRVPMLFLQGTRDPFARTEKLTPIVERLGQRATYVPIDGGDHSFRVKGGIRDDEAIGASLAPAAAAFIEKNL